MASFFKTSPKFSYLPAKKKKSPPKFRILCVAPHPAPRTPPQSFFPFQIHTYMYLSLCMYGYVLYIHTYLTER